MFGIEILEVAIGLALVFLLMSFMASLVTELVSRIFAMRAKTLEAGIRNMLNDPGFSSKKELVKSELRKISLSWFEQGTNRDQAEIRLTKLLSKNPSQRELNANKEPLADLANADQQDNVRKHVDNALGFLNDKELANLAQSKLNLAQTVYNHPLVKGIYKRGWFDRLLHNSWIFRKLAKKGRPSNIPANTFSLAVFDTLMEAGKEGAAPESRAAQPHARTAFQTMNTGLERIGNEQVKGVLRSILTSAQSEAKELDEALANARTSFENWFDDGMERVAGWYKRQAQIIIIIASIIVVSVLNVDSITIANTLWRDDALRDAVVQAAEQRIAVPPGEPSNIDDLDGTITKLQEELEGFDLPIGWKLDTNTDTDKPSTNLT